MTRLNVTGLEKFTNYTFWVNAVNQAGVSPGAKIMKQTLADSKLD